MAHFAQINESNIVVNVVVFSNSDLKDNTGEEREWIGSLALSRFMGGTWIQTSYNGNFRKKYAAVGDTYDAELDAFISPKPSANLVLDLYTCLWVPPIEQPDDRKWYWDDYNCTWVLSE